MSKWSIHRTMTGRKVFESDDPQEIVDRAHELERRAKAQPPYPGETAGTYTIVGDPFELGVVHEHDHHGKLLRGPKNLRRPRAVSEEP